VNSFKIQHLWNFFLLSEKSFIFHFKYVKRKIKNFAFVDDILKLINILCPNLKLFQIGKWNTLSCMYHNSIFTFQTLLHNLCPNLRLRYILSYTIFKISNELETLYVYRPLERKTANKNAEILENKSKLILYNNLRLLGPSHYH
jgi:hypothetical protein